MSSVEVKEKKAEIEGESPKTEEGIEKPSKISVVDSSVAADVKSKAHPKKKRQKVETIKPTHILMALSVKDSIDKNGAIGGIHTNDDQSAHSESKSGVNNRQRVLQNMDPHIQNDYIAKRKRNYETCDWDMAKRSRTPPSLILHPWDGVSKVEQALVECCELPMDTDGNGKAKNPKNEYGEMDIADSDEYIRQRIAASSSWSLGGVVAVEHEARFAAVLATQCHSMVSRSLAMAILERTIEMYLREKAAEEEDASRSEKDDESTVNGDEKSFSMDHESDEVNSRSSRFTRIQNRRRRLCKIENRPEEDYIRSPIAEESGGYHRLERFFSAGGLRVLSQWLADASDYDLELCQQPKMTPSNKKSSKSPPDTVIKRRAPPTRPIAYTILRFLEHIPVEKNIVMSSKINKQVQKLGKRIASIIEAEKAGGAGAEDLENWTTDQTLSPLDALGQVREAVNAVKASWREKTAQESPLTESFVDPFQKLQDQIKERLEELTQFEAGVGPTPEWYFEDNSSSTNKSNAPVLKKLTKMQEMAALERKTEREKLQQKIKEVKRKNQASLALLKEKLRKQREDFGLSSLLPKKEGGGKRVCWKDGLNTQKMRHRKKLEEVFVYVKGTPSAGWDDAPTEKQQPPPIDKEKDRGIDCNYGV